ncbi:hypothetical protein FRC05_002959 [Tulasnella sp. 425]|nr:hypothetical protein FRC05_002959 [Tulasnella sp. 425]
MEEEHDEHDGNFTSSSHPSQPDKTKGNRHREPKVLSSKEFPLKLFRMLDDETITNYVTWSKSESLNALYIPDIKAFEVNVMPKHFKEMKEWGSFQRQLHHYGFQKQDRGRGKALYAHSDNKFHKECPDLLLRMPNRKKKVFISQDSSPAPARPTTPIGATSPQSEGQIDPDTEDQLKQLKHENERLKKEIVELKNELECSKARHSAAEDRLLVMENQLRKPDWFSTGYVH